MLKLWQDEKYGIEWFECDNCGEQHEPHPIDTLNGRPRPCYFCKER